MQNAAARLLGRSREEIRNLAAEIIMGQMRVVIASKLCIRDSSRPIRWPKPQQKTRPRPPLSNRRQAFPSRIPGLSRESSPTG